MDINNPEIQEKARSIYQDLLNTPSPTGCTEEIIEKLKNYFSDLNCHCSLSPTGKLFVQGTHNQERQRHILFLIHVDNIGLSVKNVEKNKINFCDLGAVSLINILGFRCTVHSEKYDEKYPGRIMAKTSSKIFDVEKVDEQKIDHKNVHVELFDDKKYEKVESGDIISLDSQLKFLDDNLVSSCGQDNKAGILALYMACWWLKKNDKNTNNFTIGFNTTEEIGEPIDTDSILKKPDICVIIDAIPRYEYLKNIKLEDVFIARHNKAGFYNKELRQYINKIAEIYHIKYQTGMLDRYACDGTVKSLKTGWDIPKILYGYPTDYVHQLETTSLVSILNCAKITAQLLID